MQHKPIGILCINHNITPYLEVRRFLTDSVIRDREMHPKLAGLESQNASVIYENFQGNVSEVIRTLIDKALEGSTKAPSKLSLQEKMSVIEELNENGLFLLKGSIPAIAMKLGVSEPTIYRYLSKVKKAKTHRIETCKQALHPDRCRACSLCSSYLSRFHDTEFPFPITGVDCAQWIMGQQPVFDDQVGNRGMTIGDKDRIVADAEPADYV